MSDVAPSPAPRTPAAASRLRRILCEVHGGRPARHAVDQALAPAGPGATVHFVAVCDAARVGATKGASADDQRAGRTVHDLLHGHTSSERAATDAVAA